MSCEVWLKNEGLLVRESPSKLYIWFCEERGMEKSLILENLNLLGEHMHGLKEERNYKERKWENVCVTADTLAQDWHVAQWRSVIWNLEGCIFSTTINLH